MILRSSIFRKLLLSGFLLIAVTVAIMDFYLTRDAARQQVEHVERVSTAQARILAGELPLEAGALRGWVQSAARRAQARVTIISRDGVVLADSGRDPESMENHRGRPEIQQAIQGRAASAIRHSATLNRDLCYLAYPIDEGGRNGSVLRIAVPLDQLDSAIAAMRWRVAGASLAAAALALLVAYYFSRRFTSRVRALQAFAEKLPENRFKSLPPQGSDEIGALGNALNRMGAQIGDLVDRLSLESARMQAILASMVEGVLAVDRERRVTFCNQSFARAIGARGAVKEGAAVQELVRHPELLDMIDRVLASGEPAKARLQLPPGGSRAFEVQTAPLPAPSRRGVIVILYDIGDLERLERIRKDFVANVSHELRTPLTAIQGYAETLLDGALEDRANNRKFLEIIKAHSIRLNNIASDLLVLSDLESGNPAPEEEAFSLRGAVDTALRTVESEARARGVALECGALDDVEVPGYRIRLEQALVNLLDNAIKFNHPGGRVRIETALSESEVRIAVSDTGIGIPEADLSRIFERFYRVDNARSRQVGGTGLGLSIVKHVVERMRGAIRAESEPGKGSTFTIALPRV